MHSAPISIATVFGTRPEAVKLLPVIRLLAADKRFSLLVAVTGQHREMMREILDPFGVTPDVDLEIMRPGQTLNDIVCRAMPRLDALYQEKKPHMVLVQGDTTSAFAAALAAFEQRIPVVHLEAGLRSHDRFHPYPEESNRRMLSAIAELHLAPTMWARQNLVVEGVPKQSIVVTGNTVVDALLLALGDGLAPDPSARRTVLITLHRREAWEVAAAGGKTVLEGILLGIRSAAERHAEVQFIYPVHLNPNVQRAARAVLASVANVQLVEPLPYLRFVQTMARSSVIVTDSGGVQEEAPSLGVPVLVVRRTTERPEAVRAGMNQLVGTDPVDIARELSRLLLRPAQPRGVIPRPNPFGDGRAASRVLQGLLHYWDRAEAPDEFVAPEETPVRRSGHETLGGSSA